MTSEDRALDVEQLLAHTAWMHTLARSLVGDAELAHDLTQEALLAALRRPPRPGTPPRAWLGSVLRKLAAAWKRSEAHRRQREERVARSAVEEPAELLEELELQRALAEALLALDEPYRHTVLLRHFRGLSSAEIARRTSTPEGTVRWRLKRGLDTLRERLDGVPGGRERWLPALAAWIDPRPAPRLEQGPTLALELRRVLPLCALLGGGVAALVLLMDPAPSGGPSPVAEHSLAPRAHAPSAERRPPPPETSTASARDDLPTGPARAEAEQLVTLRARVRTRTALAIPGAHLRALEHPRGAACESDLEGELELALDARWLAASPLRELRLEASGQLPRTIALCWRGESTLWLGALELEPAAALFGRVLDARGEPAAGAEVLVEDLRSRAGLERLSDLPLREWSYVGSMLPPTVPRTIADAQGRFRFDALPECFVRVWARAEGSFAGWSEPLGLIGGESRELAELRLVAPEQNEVVEGIVVDPSGEPVPAALVRAWRASRAQLFLEGDEMANHALTDGTGRFRLLVNPNPAHEIGASDPAGRWRRSRPLRARGGERGLRIELLEPERLLVEATDERGRALETFEVESIDAESELTLGRVSFAAGAREQPSIDLPSRPFSLRFWSPGFERGQLGPIDPARAQSPVRLALAPAALLRGRVRDEDGPCAGARVQLLRGAARGSRCFPALTLGSEPLATFIDHEGLLDVTLCDAQGNFELALESAGSYYLRVLGREGPGAFVGPLRHEASARPERLELRLRAPAAIEGEVLVDPGRSPEGTLVAATRGDGALRIARVGPDGRFALDGIAEGAWQVRALARDLFEGAAEELVLVGSAHSASASRAPCTPRFDLELKSGERASFALDLRSRARVRLEGRLVIDGGAPGPWRASLAAAAEPERALATTELDPRGEFELELSAEGSYELRLWLPGYRVPRMILRRTLDLRAGGTRWDSSLAFATLRARRGALLERHPQGLIYLWEGADGLRCELQLGELELARPEGLRLPAGPARIVACEREGCDPREAPEVLGLELAPGETRELSLE